MLDISEVRPLGPFSRLESDTERYQPYFDYFKINFTRLGLCKHHGFGAMSLGGFDIAVHEYRVEKPMGTLVFIHGYLDHSGSQKNIIRFFLERSYNVYLFDLPGHGLSSGERASIVDFNEYQQVLTEFVAYLKLQGVVGPCLIAGHSTGAAIAMHFIQANRHHIFDRLLLIAPLVEPYRWFLIKYQVRLMRRFRKKVKREFGRNTDDDKAWFFMRYQDPLQAQWIAINWVHALLKWLTNDFIAFTPSNIPALMIQGDNDSTVNGKKNRRLIGKKFTNLGFVSVPEGKHNLLNEDEGRLRFVMDAIARWI